MTKNGELGNKWIYVADFALARRALASKRDTVAGCTLNNLAASAPVLCPELTNKTISRSWFIFSFGRRPRLSKFRYMFALRFTRFLDINIIKKSPTFLAYCVWNVCFFPYFKFLMTNLIQHLSNFCLIQCSTKCRY